MFLRVLNEGNECAFGSRLLMGVSIQQSSYRKNIPVKIWNTTFQFLLGTKMYDMTSGFQGFHASVVETIY